MDNDVQTEWHYSTTRLTQCKMKQCYTIVDLRVTFNFNSYNEAMPTS